MGVMLISSFQLFCFDVKYPFMVFCNPFVGGKGSVSFIPSCFPCMSPDTKLILLRTACLSQLAWKCLLSTLQMTDWRMKFLFNVDCDTLLAAHHEVVDIIISHHWSHEVMSSNPQVIKLPFPCEQDISKQMIWNEGGHLLYEMFRCDLKIQQSWHQVHLILCITVKSNKKARNCNWEQMRVISSRNSHVQGGRGEQDN